MKAFLVYLVSVLQTEIYLDEGFIEAGVATPPYYRSIVISYDLVIGWDRLNQLCDYRNNCHVKVAQEGDTCKNFQIGITNGRHHR